MKPKKTAFANTSTGYGRNKHGFLRSNQNSKSDTTTNSKNDKKTDKTSDAAAADANKPDEKDNDLNSGFGDYLRTPEAFEMMKLFVFANTIMLIVTMAWPNIKEQFFWLNEWWENFQYERA